MTDERFERLEKLMVLVLQEQVFLAGILQQHGVMLQQIHNALGLPKTPSVMRACYKNELDALMPLLQEWGLEQAFVEAQRRWTERED